jgi:DNA polymerase
MRWTERQQAMLRAMGVPIWQPGEPAPASDGVDPLPDQAEPADSQRAMPEPQGVQAPVESPRSRDVAQPAPDAERAQAVSRMDWPELREAVTACRACGLCETRRQTVFGVGNEHAHWMIVGEAPGEQEDLQGEPFVGPAGQLLDRMLLSLGLTRGEAEPSRQVYIANTLKCRPPRNRNPEPRELGQCLPFLERQVALVRPRVILAMGRFAVQALLGSDEPIGKLRGRVHPWQGRPLVVTYHPAYLLRQPTEKARAWADLCLAAEALERSADRPRG